MDWNEVFSLAGAISANEELDCILEKHADLFREGYDGMKGLEAHIRVRENASPIYFKSRPVIIIEMTGLHGSLRYVVYIFMNAAFIFLP